MANEKVIGGSVIDAPAPPLPGASRPSARDVTSDEAGMSVVVINDFTVLEKYVPAWEDLGANAIEPNAFYEPWMMMRAIRAFGAGRRLQFALVLANEPARHDGRLFCADSSRWNSKTIIKG